MLTRTESLRWAHLTGREGVRESGGIKGKRLERGGVPGGKSLDILCRLEIVVIFVYCTRCARACVCVYPSRKI